MGYKAKIYYHHTDAGGVVYYGRYLNLLEEARTAFLAERGVDVRGLTGQDRFFVVSRQEIDYRHPASYGEELDIETRLVQTTGVRLELSHLIRNPHGQPVAEARTVLAFVDKTFRPRRLPETVREQLEA